jgi:hypothetical protein
MAVQYYFSGIAIVIPIAEIAGYFHKRQFFSPYNSILLLFLFGPEDKQNLQSMSATQRIKELIYTTAKNVPKWQLAARISEQL